MIRDSVSYDRDVVHWTDIFNRRKGPLFMGLENNGKSEIIRKYSLGQK